jgi:hypothetical protein
MKWQTQQSSCGAVIRSPGTCKRVHANIVHMEHSVHARMHAFSTCAHTWRMVHCSLHDDIKSEVAFVHCSVYTVPRHLGHQKPGRYGTAASMGHDTHLCDFGKGVPERLWADRKCAFSYQDSHSRVIWVCAELSDVH